MMQNSKAVEVFQLNTTDDWWKADIITMKQTQEILIRLVDLMEMYAVQLEGVQRDYARKKAEHDKNASGEFEQLAQAYHNDQEAIEEEYSSAVKVGKKLMMEIDDACKEFSLEISLAKDQDQSVGWPFFRRLDSRDWFGSLFDQMAKVVSQSERETGEYNRLALELRKASEANVQNDYEAAVAHGKERNIDATRELLTWRDKMTKHAQQVFHQSLDTYYPPDQIREWIASIMQGLPKFDNYEPVQAVPSHVYFGKLIFSLHTSRSGREGLPGPILQIVREHFMPSGVVRDTSILMPYCQDMRSGMGMCIMTQEAPSLDQLNMLRSILLRLLVSMPLRKVEATMIDPTGMGATFTLFGPLLSKQMDQTSAITRPESIEQALEQLSANMTNIRSVYGDEHMDKMMKQEPLRVLAISNYPASFTQRSFALLGDIVQNMEKCGLAVFVMANRERLDSIVATQKNAVMRPIMRLPQAVAQEESLLLSLDKDVSVEFRPDMIQSADQSNAIVQCMLERGESIAPREDAYEELFPDIVNEKKWNRLDTVNGISVPLGIEGAVAQVNLTLGELNSTNQHVLISGQIGSGKSTLLHTIIMGLLMRYKPEDLALYLVDFKEGVEFKEYADYDLYPIRVVAVKTEREFGLSILQELCSEYERRSALFKANDVESILRYREKSGKEMPRIIAIFDEFQELFQAGDAIAKESATCMETLTALARCFGIQLILATQNAADVQNFPESVKNKMMVRIALRGDVKSAQAVMPGHPVAELEALARAPVGQASIDVSGGGNSKGTRLQVSRLREELRRQYMKVLEEIQRNDSELPPGETLLMLGSISDSRHHPLYCIDDAIKLENEDAYRIYPGIGFSMSSMLCFDLELKPGDNVLVIGRNAELARKVLVTICFSVLHSESANPYANKQDELLHIIEPETAIRGAEGIQFQRGMFAHLFDHMPQIVQHTSDQATAQIHSLYDELARRKGEATKGKCERLFMFIVGLQRMNIFGGIDAYKKHGGKSSEQLELLALLHEGAAHGIHLICWSDSVTELERIFDVGAQSFFNNRIAVQLDHDDEYNVMREDRNRSISKNIALLYTHNMPGDNRAFRPFDVPLRSWMDGFIDSYLERAGLQED